LGGAEVVALISSTTKPGEAALELRHLSKTFGGTAALRDTDLVVRRGEIHGLVGRNGSGKSTLIKILSGFYEPDEGAELHLGGRRIDLPVDPATARKHGLTFVHQDLALAPGCTVMENMRIGRYRLHGLGRIDWNEERTYVRAALAKVGLDLSPDAMLQTLRPVNRALVAIARALGEVEEHEGLGVLVLDEPTTFLPRGDVDVLFEGIRQIAARGTSVLFVSHRVEEIISVTDRVSVLLDGVRTATVETAATPAEKLVELILGRELKDLYPERGSRGTDKILTVKGLTGSIIGDVDFSIHRGEIVGMTGIAGMGHDELPYLLFGAQPAAKGEISLSGKDPVAAAELSPNAAMKLGLALLPADRLWASGVAAYTVRENVSLPIVRNFFRGGWLRQRQEHSVVADLLQAFQVTPPRPNHILGALSGGNQQKALLAKWLQMRPPVLILHDPTQGVDLGAKKEVFGHIENAAAAGSAVVICSSEYEDLAHLCHRVLVFRDGQIAAELAGSNLTEDHIVDHCYRQRSGIA